MNLDAYFTEIDSVAFSARASVASGFRVFRRIIAEDPTAKDLIERISAETKLAEIVASHATKVAISGVRDGYLNYFDEAIAAYLYALFVSGQIAQFMHLESVVRSLGNFWWAKRLGEQLLRDKIHETGLIAFSTTPTGITENNREMKLNSAQVVSKPNSGGKLVVTVKQSFRYLVCATYQ
jgi:hypothetical protein